MDYTYFGGPPEYVIHAIKANLTASLRESETLGRYAMSRRNSDQFNSGLYTNFEPDDQSEHVQDCRGI